MTPVEIMEAIRAIEPGTVTRAYEGKAGKCCCGCSGKYFEAEQKDSVLRILYLIKAYATELHNEIPGAQVTIIPDTGHMLHVEKADAVADAVVAFAG